MQTAMANSSGAVGATPSIEKFHKAEFLHERSGVLYKVRKAGERLALDYEQAGQIPVRVSRDMPWFVGSGSEARSYLLDVKGFLFQAPVAWYAKAARWDLAPGYARNEQPYLSRPIVLGCLQCHASDIQHTKGTQNHYDKPPFREGGVACERCHGPGAAHIAFVRSRQTGSGLRIVNPAKLEPNRRDSVCEQCHLSGVARVTRAGANNHAFTAGELLSDYVAVFVRASGTPTLKVTSHSENLSQSVCKIRAGDKLWCGTCHDAHSIPTSSQRASWFRSKCLTCHQTSSCIESAKARQSARDDCTTCHMPKSNTVDAEHVVYTDHSIPRRVRKIVDAPVADAALVPFAGAPVSARDEGIAYAIAGQHSRAFDILKRSVTLESSDAEALLYLADLFNRDIGTNHRRDLDKAISFYERAIQLDPSQLSGSVSLGAIRMEQKRFDDAIRHWTDALRKNPALVLVRFHLARALVSTGRRAEGERVLEGALEFNPSFQPAREALELLKKGQK
jgi:hypothetical protein